MVKNYIINQLTQISAWLGVAIIIAAIVAPVWVVVLFGVFLIMTDDKKLQDRFAKWSPSIKRALGGDAA